MPMVTTFKFKNAISISCSPGYAQGAHYRLSAGGNKPQHFDPWQARSDPFSQFKRVRLAGAKTPGCLDRVSHGVGDVAVTMPEHQRPEALTKIDVLSTIDRGQRSALRAAKEHGRATDAFECTHRAMHTTGRYPRRALEKLTMECAGRTKRRLRFGCPCATQVSSSDGDPKRCRRFALPPHSKLSADP